MREELNRISQTTDDIINTVESGSGGVGGLDPYSIEVISLLNFAGMPDGTVITDTISGNTWTALNGASIVSGELVLDGLDDYVQHTDSTGFRYEFNGNLSAYFTIEVKIVTSAALPATTRIILDWRDTDDARGMSIQLAPDHTFRFRAGDSTVGWDVDLSTTTVAAPSTEYELTFGMGRAGYACWVNGKYEAIGQLGNLLNMGSAGLRLGRGSLGAFPFNGKYQRIRFTKKTTRYIANDYTPEAGNSYAYP